MTLISRKCGARPRDPCALALAVFLTAAGAQARTLVVESSPAPAVSIAVSPPDLAGAAGGVTQFTRNFPDSAEVTLTAPNTVGRYRFVRWRRDGVDSESSLVTHVTMEANHTLRAMYEEVVPVFPANLQIMPLGDSITYGYNGSNAGYRGPLYSLLAPQASNFRYIGTSTERPGSLPSQPINQRFHEGHSSYSILDISNNLDGFDNARFLQFGGPERNPNGGYWFTGGNGTGRAPVFPDIITLMVGTNDLDNPAGVEGRLRGLITKITTQRPNAKLFLAKITPVPQLTTDEAYNLIIPGVVADFQAAGKDIHLVDLNTGFPANGLDSDQVHPNDTGFNWMANRWFEAIVAAYSPPAISRPFHIAPAAIPGRIEAEDFNRGGAGISYQDLSPANAGGQYREDEGVDIEATNDVDGGYQVFHTEAGEWLRYFVTVDTPGGYVPSLRISNPTAGGEVFLEVDGYDATNNVAIPENGGDGSWHTVTLPEIQLSAGNHVLRLVIAGTAPGDTAGAINWLALDTASRTSPSARAGPDLSVTDLDGSGSEPVALDASASIAGDSPNLTYTWWRGGVWIASGINPTVNLPVGTQVIQLTVTDDEGKEGTDEVLVTVSPKSLFNGSFESDLSSWTVSGNVRAETNAPFSPTDGVKLAGFNGADLLPNGILTQSLATVVGGTYTLEFDAGALSFNTDFQSIQVTVDGGGTLLTQTITIQGPGGGNSRWLPQSFTFVANSPTTTLTFRDVSATSAGIDLLLDNIRISGPSPFPVNSAPVAAGESYTTNEGAALTVPPNGVLANDSDPDGNPLAAVTNVRPLHGTLGLNLNGSFTYTPAAGFFGNDSFTYHASDGFLNSNIATVQLVVNEVIPPPVSAADSYATNEYTELMVPAPGVLANDADTRSRPITAILDTGPGHGTLALNANGSFNYSPDAGYFGADSFTYHSRNGYLDSEIVTVAINVIEFILPPVALADAFVTDEGIALVVPPSGVLANDSDPRARPLTAILNSAPEHGTLVMNPDGSFIYTPASGYFGADSFTYHARNGFKDSDIMTVEIQVNEVIPPPVAAEDAFATDENAALVVPAGGVLTNDADPRSRPLTAVLDTGPAHGTLGLAADGGFSYTPAHSYFGADSFTYHCRNGFLDSDPVTVSLTIREVIPPPAAVPDFLVADEATPLVIPAAAILANDSDPRGRPLTAVVDSGPAHGSLVLNPDGSLTYTPSYDFFGADAFTYHARNGFLNSPPVSVSITVNEVVPAPLVEEDWFATFENTSLVVPSGGVLFNDADRRARPLTAVLDSPPANGTVALDEDGGFSYTPAAEYYGTDSFTYHARNGFVDSETVTVHLVIHEIIPPPVPAADSYQTDENIRLAIPSRGVLDNDVDPRFRPLTAVIDSSPGHGTLALHPDGGFSYAPEFGYFGFDSFTYHADNGILPSEPVTVSLTVNEVIPPPLATADSYTTDENIPLAVPAAGVLANDSDPRSRPLTAVVDTAPGHGNLVLNANGGFTYTPAAGYYGPDSFTYHASNGFLPSNTVPVAIFVREVIPPPFATADQYETDENIPLVVPASGILANDADPRGRPITAVLETGPSHGTLELAADGGFIYLPDHSYFGNDSFTYHVNNGFLNSGTVTVDIAIHEVVPAPVAVADSYITDEGTPLVIPDSGVLGNDSDPRLRTLTAVLDDGPVHGSLSLNPGGGFTYTPVNGYYGSDSFTYHSHNGFLDSEAVRVDITVNEIVPPPVAVADAYSTDEDTPLTLPPAGVLANDSDPRARPLTAVLETGTTHGSIDLGPDGSFTYLPSAGYIGPDSFTYHIHNGFLDSNTVTVSLAVKEVIPPPVSGNDAYVTQENTPLVVPPSGVLGNDSDPRSRPITAVLDAGPLHGTLGLDANGGFTYTPAPGYFGTDSFTYHSNNGFLDSNVATVSLTIQEVIPPPVAVADTYATNESTPLVVAAAGVLANDADPRARPLTAVLNAGPAHGALVLNPDGSFSYTPANGYFGSDQFTYHANNGFLNSNVVTVDITILEVPPPPLAAADSYSTNQGTALVVPAAGLLANDSDPRSHTLTAVLNAGPAHGTLSLNANGAFTYTPVAAYFGPDSFTYHANNGFKDSNIVTVTINIAPLFTGLVNGSFESDYSGWTATGNQSIGSSFPYAPTDGTKLVGFGGDNQPATGVLSQSFTTIPGDSYTLTFDAGVLSYNTNSQTIQVTVNGTGSLLTRTITIFGLGNGTNRWAPQSFTFVADSSATTLTFRDQSAFTQGLDLLLDNVKVSAPPPLANTAPVAIADSYSTNQDSALVVPAAGVLANDTDAQSQPLTAILNSGPSHGSLTLNPNGGFTYNPATGYSGNDSFTYHANDGTLNSNVVTVSLTLNPVISPPVAAADSYITDEGTALVIPGNGVLANDLDPASLPLTAVLNTGPGHGTLSLNANGGFNYTPTTGYFGSDSFTYHANNGTRDSNIVTVSITINELIPAPVAVADSYTANQDTNLVVPASGVLANDSDPRSRPLTAVLDSAPAHGTLSLNANGGFNFTPATGYFGNDSFSYHARNGSKNSNVVTVTLSITQAVAVGLVNGSFESGFTGWTATGSQAVQSATYYAPTNGTRLVVFNGGNLTPNGTLSQTFATTPGQSCTLAFDAGVFAYNTDSQTMNVTVTGTGNLLNRTITLFGNGVGTSVWQAQTFSFVANSSTTTLTFRDQSSATQAIDLLLDNVRVTATAAPALPPASQIQSGYAGSPDASPGTPSLAGVPGDLTIRLDATRPGSYFLERSEDLSRWSQIDGPLEVTAPGPVEFHDRGDSLVPQVRKPRMFYRIGRGPSAGAAN